MYVAFVVIVAIAVSTIDCASKNISVIPFLQKYGFLSDDNAKISIDDSSVKSAIALFQEYYQLPGDGELNNATLDLMGRPRCGNRDIPNHRRNTQQQRWSKKHLTWNFQFANKQTLKLTEIAFSMWAAITPLTFQRKTVRPDIMIMYAGGAHMMSQIFNNSVCEDSLDGLGGVLAHALAVGLTDKSIIDIADVHVDIAEPWYIKLDKNPDDMPHLLNILVHEIGHALGLGHSTRTDAMMYGYILSEHTWPVKLTIDDVLAIQNLYGVRNNNTPEEIPTTTLTPTEQTPEYIHMCDTPYVDNVLVLDHRMFITYKHHAWSVNIDDKKYSKSIVMTDYMTFLPKNVNLTAAYQQPSGDIVLFEKNMVYMLGYPSFNVKSGWPREITEIGLPRHANITIAINTNKGRTYVVFDGNNIAEIDDCSMSVVRYHALQTIFPGIPTTVRSAFRYIDGHIYFMDKKQYYKYNEFTNRLVTAGKFDLSILGIECPTNSVLQQLRDLLNRLVRSDPARNELAMEDDGEKNE